MTLQTLEEWAAKTEKPKVKKRTSSAQKANELNGNTWLQYSISVWNDIKKTPEELKLGHPAMFPVQLVKTLYDY